MSEFATKPSESSTFAAAILSMALLGSSVESRCSAQQEASESNGWGTIYNATDQIVTISVHCGNNGPKRIFTLLSHEVLNLRYYSRYEVDLPETNYRYIVDARAPMFKEGGVRRLTKWQMRFYYIGVDDDGTLALFRGMPEFFVSRFMQTFKDSLASSGLDGTLSPADNVIWKIIQDQLIDQAFKDCLEDYMESHIPLRYEYFLDNDSQEEEAKSKEYLLNINTGRIPLSPEVRAFVVECIAAAYKIKVKRVTSHGSIEQFLLLASHLAPAFREPGGKIVVPNIIKLLQEKLQGSKLRAEKIREDENGIILNTDWLRPTNVPKAFEGADIRWRLRITALRKHSAEYEQDYLDYNCVVQVISKPRSARPNNYRMITVPAGLTYKLEERGKKSDTALETIPGAFEHQVYQILTGGR
jgi:hypothetical protein